MKKHRLILTILFLMIFSLGLFAGVETKAQEGLLAKPMIPDMLKDFTIKKEVRDFFEKIFEFWRPINEKGKNWWQGLTKPNLKEWLNNKKTALKQGWQEEKQELRNFFDRIFRSLWQKIKSKLR